MSAFSTCKNKTPAGPREAPHKYTPKQEKNEGKTIWSDFLSPKYKYTPPAQEMSGVYLYLGGRGATPRLATMPPPPHLYGAAVAPGISQADAA